MNQRVGRILSHFATLVLLLFSSAMAFAVPGKTTYQAKIVKPDGYPLEATSVNFKFTILDPAGSCILYAETYSSVNMSSTGGLISFALGSGVKTYPVSATTFEQVFSNITPSLSCDTGGPTDYSPSATDIRKIVMQFHDGNGWQTLPAMSINAVPYAMYANEATKLNGLTSSDFVQVSTVPTCAASEALRYTGAAFTCIAVGNSVTSGTVITALGYTPADGASVTALTATTNAVSTTVASVSSTVFSVSSTVTSLQNSVAASFAAITSSQWTTSSTNIFYNAGSVGIGTTAPNALLHLKTSGTALTLHETTANNDYAVSRFSVPTHTYEWAVAGSAAPSVANAFYIYDQTNSSVPFLVSAIGNIGVGTTTPVTKLDVSGGVRIGAENTTCAPALAGTLRYNASNVEYCNGTSWQAFGVSGAGITNFNGSTSGTQTFATGTGGTAPVFNTSNGVHTLNIPLASTGSVTAGLISNADYTTFTNKITSSAASIAQVLGYVPADNAASGTYAQKANNLSDLTNVATARTNLGLGTFATASSIDLGSASATGTLAIARLPSFSGDATIAAASNTIILSNSGVTTGTYTKVTVDSKGRVTSSSALASSDVTTALGYTPASATASTQWTTSGSAIYYNTGNVGIGTAAPGTALDVLGIISSRSSSTWGSGANSTFKAVDPNGLLFSLGLDAGNTKLELNTQYGTMPIVFSVGNSEKIRVDSTGNVGIGTTAPTAKLHVQDGAAVIKGTGSILTVKKGFGSPNTLSTESVASFDNESGSGVAVNFFGNSGQAASIYMGDTAVPKQGIIKYFVNSAIPTNQYMSFSTSSTERLRISYVGNVGIDTTNPSAKLHLPAGTSSIAALKFTSGTLLTSPQSGTMEYDGTNFYLTDSTNTRRAIAANTNPGTYDNVSDINSSSNITLTPTGSVVVSSTTASTNSSTGALVVKGGLGVAGNLNVAGTISGSAKVMATGFRANQGSPDSNDSSTNGYAFGADGDTGMFSPGSGAANGVLAFYGNNAELMRITSSGAVGIGTTNPLAKLHLTDGSTFRVGQNTADSGNRIEITNGIIKHTYQSGDTRFNLVSNGALDLGMPAAYDAGAIALNKRVDDANFSKAVISGGNAGGVGELHFFTNNDVITPKMVVRASGNVGIGTTAPTELLHVSGSAVMGDMKFWKNLTGGEFQAITGNGDLRPHMGISGSFRLYSGNVGSGTEKFTVLNSGNVGIGTTSPGSALSIKSSTANNTTGDGFTNLRLEYAGGYNAGDIGAGVTFAQQYVDPGTDAAAIRVGGIFGVKTQATGNFGGGLAFFRQPAGAANMSEAMRIDQNGNVGIGTTTPISPLEVHGGPVMSGGWNRTLRLQASHPAIQLRGTAQDNKSAWIEYDDATTTNALSFRVGGTSDDLGTAVRALSIIPSGNIGIGTINPTAKLDVNGAVKATAFVVGSTTYTLPTNDPDTWVRIASGSANSYGEFKVYGSSSSQHGFMHFTVSCNFPNGNTDTCTITVPHKSEHSLQVIKSVRIVRTNGTYDPYYVELLLGNNPSTVNSISVELLNNSSFSVISPAVAGSIPGGYYAQSVLVDSIKTSLANGAFNVNKDGNVGIGTTNPTVGLEVSGRSKISTSLANVFTVTGKGTTYADATDGIAVFYSEVTTGAGGNIIKAGSAYAPNTFVVKDSGYVGIGTMAPSAKLEVSGDIALGASATETAHHTGLQRLANGTSVLWYGGGTSSLQIKSGATGPSGDRVTITASGNVGIGTTAPGYKLDVSGDVNISSGNALRFGGTQVCTSAGCTSSSDRRLKENINPLSNSLEKILQLQGVEYDYNDKTKYTGQHQVGVIAQDVEKIYPEVVVTDGKTGLKAVAYDHLIAPMIEAFKTLYRRIVGVESDVSVLQREMASVKADNTAKDQKIKELEAYLCSKDPAAPICK